ncbi:MAG: glycosyltransferase family 61 protein [Bacteroidota bacterium]
MGSATEAEVEVPVWFPSNEVLGMAQFKPLPEVLPIENKMGKSQDIFSRVKASCFGKFYTRYCKQYPLFRRLVTWVWKNIYLALSNNVAIHFKDQNISSWRRLVRLSEFVHQNKLAGIELLPSASIETSLPQVFPSCDQVFLPFQDDRYRFPSVYLATISGGMIYGGSNLVLRKKEVICHDLYDFERDYTSEELHGRIRIDPRKQRLRCLIYDESPARFPVAAAFVDSCAHNYAHWLTEVLPRIVAFCAEDDFLQVPLVVDAGLHKNIMESLFLVAGRARKIITLPIGRALAADTLYLASVTGYVPFDRRNCKISGHSHGVFSPLAFERMRNKIVPFAEKLPGEQWPEKIYLRRNSSGRNVTNAEELEAFLIVKGYSIIEPEKFSFLQQVSLFRNAKKIIAPTGAALSNAIFSRPATRVAILMAKHENMIYRYWLNMLSAVDVKCSYVLGSIVKDSHLGIHADFSVDVGAVGELIQSWDTE